MPLKIVSVGVVLRPHTPSLRDRFLNIQDIFNKHNINVILEDESADMIGYTPSKSFEYMLQNSDMLISLGGDGTLLSLARRSFDSGKACMGINMGRLGFLTNITENELEYFASNLANGIYEIKEHMILEAFISTYDKGIIALNEMLITKKDINGMVKIQAKIDGREFNTYSCDGLLISTPTGSTAYNISAGGPVVYPYCRNIILNPVAPHSLTQRPLVLSDEFALEFQSQVFTKLVIDGQDTYDIEQNTPIKIKAHAKSMKFIYSANRDYFDVLKRKFSWGENP